MYSRSTPRIHAAAYAGACLVLLAMSQPAHTAITTSGQVLSIEKINQPSKLIVGDDQIGSLTIDAGSSLDSADFVTLGKQPGSVGTVVVSGSGSVFNLGTLDVGEHGQGHLVIEDGGTVNVGGSAQMDLFGELNSSIHLDRGTLNVRSLFVDINHITGTGTINVNNIVANGFDLVFDSKHGWDQTVRLNQNPGQDISLNLIYPYVSGTLGAGGSGKGSLTIREGAVISSIFGYIGAGWRSDGTLNISGSQSAWNTEILSVGAAGRAVVNITDGGMLSTESLFLGPGSDAGGGSTLFNLANGGMFMLLGEAEGSLMAFYELMYPDLYGWSDSLRYWDSDLNTWTGLTNATPGEDYTLQYHDAGELTGYTVLTVNTVPEPHTLTLVGLGTALCLHRRRLCP